MRRFYWWHFFLRFRVNKSKSLFICEINVYVYAETETRHVYSQTSIWFVLMKLSWCQIAVNFKSSTLPPPLPQTQTRINKRINMLSNCTNDPNNMIDSEVIYLCGGPHHSNCFFQLCQESRTIFSPLAKHWHTACEIRAWHPASCKSKVLLDCQRL